MNIVPQFIIIHAVSTLSFPVFKQLMNERDMKSVSTDSVSAVIATSLTFVHVFHKRTTTTKPLKKQKKKSFSKIDRREYFFALQFLQEAATVSLSSFQRSCAITFKEMHVKWIVCFRERYEFRTNLAVPNPLSCGYVVLYFTRKIIRIRSCCSILTPILSFRRLVRLVVHRLITHF